MEQSNRKWIIRDASGHIEGPFSTEKILYKISRGEFSGEEHIAHYPDGRWIPISQDPTFYDKLLEALSSENKPFNSEDTAVFEFTRPQKTEVKNTSEADTVESPTLSSLKSQAQPAQKERKKKKKRKKPKDIELVDVRPQYMKELIKRGKWPILFSLAIVALGMVLLISSSSPEQRVHLVVPQKNQPQMDTKSLVGKLRQGAIDFSGDTFGGYVRAQNSFVYTIERNSKNGEAIAALCMTYLQLWPYAYQDSSDSKAVSVLLQWSSQVDPAGIHAATCRIVDLTIRSRFQEAKSIIESVLDSRANDAKPPANFHFLKGYILSEIGEFDSAISYLQTAQQLSPRWILPYSLEAQAHGKLEKFSNAVNLYQKILKANPNHSIARIELGLLEYKSFSQYDRAEQLLKQGLDREEAPRSVLSRGYTGLAEIALKKSDQDKALRYAQKAYSLNSSNTVAKNLIVQIGGIEKLKRTKVKGQQLLFEGDQFFREGDCHAAQAHYKAAFEQDQRNALAAMKAAQCLWRLSFSTEAMDWLGKAIKSDPKLVEAYVTLADYQARRYNFLAASRTLEEARKANPQSHEVYRGFARVELRRNNAKGALVFGKQALKLYENDVDTQILLAQASLALRDPKMAYNYAAKAVDLDVNNREAQIVYAEALSGLQGIDVGMDHLSKLVNNYQRVTEYRLALGKMLAADERYPQAEEVFRQVFRLDEKPKEAFLELAKVLKAQGNMGEALDFLLKAAVLDPADAEPLYFAGMIYIEIKKPQEATIQFQRVLAINKLYPLVHYQLGRAAMLMNNPRGALSFTELEKKTNPNLADAYLLAADAHTALGQYSMCATEFQKAIKLRPQQAFMYVKLAQCYRKAGNLDAAISMLNVASSKESGLAEIYKEQGAIYELKGDVIHAIEAYNQYFVLDPDAQDRSQIEDRINSLQRRRSP